MTLSTEQRTALRKRYTEPVIPPCHLCGEDLEMQAIGGGRPTIWACVGRDGDGGYASGRSLVDTHYSESRYEQRTHGDSHVIALLDQLDELMT